MSIAVRHEANARWSTVHAGRIAGLSFRTLDYWCRTGAVTPAVRANGSGSRRLFTRHEVWKLCVIGEIARWASGTLCDPNHGVGVDRVAVWWRLLDEPDALIDLSDGPVAFTVDPRQVRHPL